MLQGHCCSSLECDVPATEALELKEKEMKEAEKQLETSKQSLLEKDETISKYEKITLTLMKNMMLLWDKRTQIFMKYIKRMRWRNGKDFPGTTMYRGTAVVQYNTAYFISKQQFQMMSTRIKIVRERRYGVSYQIIE